MDWAGDIVIGTGLNPFPAGSSTAYQKHPNHLWQGCSLFNTSIITLKYSHSPQASLSYGAGVSGVAVGVSVGVSVAVAVGVKVAVSTIDIWVLVGVAVSVTVETTTFIST